MSENTKQILYAGDSPVGGPANYLLAILKRLSFQVNHIPPGNTLTPDILAKNYDAIILSDFACETTPNESQNLIQKQMAQGAGLLMIGGWGSFSGPFGGWKGSLVEDLLPVSCLAEDDRRNISEGLLIQKQQEHAMFSDIDFTTTPILCGLNEVQVKESGTTLLSATKINQDKGSLNLDTSPYPLLVIDSDEKKRCAALTTDVAPHWCGGFVDWGTEHQKLNVTDSIQVEVGNKYIALLSNLFKWLTRS